MNDIFDQHQRGLVFTDSYRSPSTPIVVGMTTRELGVSEGSYAHFNMGFHVGDHPSHVLENRERAGEKIGFPIENWIVAEQVHSNKLVSVTGQDRGKGAKELQTAIKKADGLFTTEPGVLLVACYADCVPIYFIAKDHSAVGIAHAGWRGTVGNIAGRMVSQWEEELSISPTDIEVIIGPSIGACCYEVDERVLNEVRALKGLETEELATPSSEGHYQLNLQLTNQRLLEKHGMNQADIHTSSFCTSCRTDLFYSHRKEMGKTGRMIGYIGINRGELD